jgi:hypothetical protein
MKNTKPCEAANIIAKICVENGCNVQSPHSPHNVNYFFILIAFKNRI